MIEPFVKNRFFLLFLFCIALGIYLFNSWGVSIYILDEAKNATCAREMLENKGWFVPTFNSVLRTDKPPLHYFFMMLSYSLFGVTPFAARFFSAVFGALTILVSFIYVRRFCGAKVAFWTAVVLLASIHLSIQFHLSVPDPYLVFFFSWALLAFFAAVKTKCRRDIYFMYIAMALGTLAKGPVAILLPGLIFLLFLLFSRNFNGSTIKNLQPFAGISIVLLIVLPWFILNGIQTNWEWTNGFFFEHNLHRFSDTMEGHGGSFLLTFLYVFIGLFPFAVFLPRAIYTTFKNRRNDFLLFALIAGISIVAFFAVSKTKLPNYTVPAYPFIAVMLGYFIAEKVKIFRQIRVGYFVLLFFSILVPIGVFFALKSDASLLSIKAVSIFFIVFPVLVFTAFFFRKNITIFLLIIGGAGLVTACIFFGVVYPQTDQLNPVQKSIGLVQDREVVYFRKFNPSYAFCLKKVIQPIEEEQLESFFAKHPEGVVISTQKKLKDIKLPVNCQIIFSGKDLFESPTTVLIGKKKNN